MGDGALFFFYGFLVDTPSRDRPLAAITIAKYLGHVRYHFALNDTPLPAPSFRLRELQRRHLQVPRERRFKDPATPALLHAVLDDKAADPAEKLACVLCWFLTLRVSDVVVRYAHRYDPRFTMLASGVEFISEAQLPPVVKVDRPRSKSDPNNLGLVSFLLPAGKDALFCPVRFLREFLRQQHPAPRGHYPLLVDRHGAFVTAARVAAVTKRAAASLGLNKARYATQSWRSGSTRALSNAGLPDSDIMLAGNWTSTAALRYFRHSYGRLLRTSRALQLDDRSKSNAAIDSLFARSRGLHGR